MNEAALTDEIPAASSLREGWEGSNLVDCFSVCVAHYTHNSGSAAYTIQYALTQVLAIYGV